MFDWIKKSIDKKSAYSVERLAGLWGWVAVIAMLFISQLGCYDLPASFDLFMVLTVVLMGIDSLVEVVSFFRSVPKNVQKIVSKLQGSCENGITVGEDSAYSEPY